MIGSKHERSIPDSLATAAVLWGGLELHGLAGPASEHFRAAAGLVSLILFAVTQSWHNGLKPTAVRWAFFALFASIVALAQATPVRGVAFAAAITAMSPPSLGGLGWGVLFASILTTVAGWLPGIAEFSTGIASAIANLFAPERTAQALEYGPSGACLPAILWTAILLTVRAVQRVGAAPLVGLGITMFLTCAQWALVAHLDDQIGLHAGHGHSPGAFRSLDFVVPLLCLLVAIGWGRVARGRVPRACPMLPHRPLLGAIGGALVGALFFLPLSGWSLGSTEDRRVAFLNAGGLDWNRPTPERLGAYETGMFGMLPAYLRRAGWEVGTTDLDDLESFSLEKARVLVVINCHHVWSLEERRLVEGFVMAGGSVLALGDHTDVFGLMRGMNTLVEPWGIAYRFDSAYFTGRDYGDSLEWKPGELGLWHDPRSAGIAIGASLDIRPPARPLLIARYGFSDTGVRENEMGSYLGNYSYDPGERLGDIVLVAGARMGRGRVVVYGDTSGFQNGSLPESFVTHVQPILGLLARKSGVVATYAVDALLVIMLLLGAAWGALRPGSLGKPTLLGFAVGLAAASTLLGGRSHAEALQKLPTDGTLVIDHSHVPNVGHYGADWNSIEPLAMASMRAGLFPYHLLSWDAEVIRRARVIALVAPGLPFSQQEIRELDAAMRRGATVLVASSAPDAPGVEALLNNYGLELSPYNTGAVPPWDLQQESEPRFIDATVIKLDQQQESTVLYRYGDLVLSTAVSVGSGWLVVIGDTRFFSSRNLEGTWGWWGGNLRFVHDILLTFCGGNPEPPKEYFGPPIRPPD